MIKAHTCANSSPLKDATFLGTERPRTSQCAKAFSCIISEQPCEVGRKLKKRRAVEPSDLREGPGGGLPEWEPLLCCLPSVDLGKSLSVSDLLFSHL